MKGPGLKAKVLGSIFIQQENLGLLLLCPLEMSCLCYSFIFLPVAPCGSKTLRKRQEDLVLASGTEVECCYLPGARGDRLSYEEPAGPGRKESGRCVSVIEEYKENLKGVL